MLAVPRPLQLERILPMVASLGVSTLVLCQARKVGWGLDGGRREIMGCGSSRSGSVNWECVMVWAILRPTDFCESTKRNVVRGFRFAVYRETTSAPQ